jgi:hypothetical protein
MEQNGRNSQKETKATKGTGVVDERFFVIFVSLVWEDLGAWDVSLLLWRVGPDETGPYRGGMWTGQA